jgi:hypothetical protein
VEVEFRFASDDLSLEISGPVDFVRPHLQFLAPFVRRAGGGTAAPAAAAAPGQAAEGIDAVGAWWETHVPPSASPTLQDSILLFAYYMRTYRKTVFMSEDIRRCFQVLGVEEPKSLLQILGTLKREHGLLLNAGRRGEYMMNTTGISRAREILGERRAEASPAGPAGAPEPIELRPKPKGKGKTDVRNIFKD